jgi:hypothetical protein
MVRPWAAASCDSVRLLSATIMLAIHGCKNYILYPHCFVTNQNQMRRRGVTCQSLFLSCVRACIEHVVDQCIVQRRASRDARPLCSTSRPDYL